MTGTDFHPAVLCNVLAYAAFQDAPGGGCEAGLLAGDMYETSEKALMALDPELYREAHAITEFFIQLPWIVSNIVGIRYDWV